ncbi:MAG: hypothetical protein JSR39_02400 [Verrucomicrobia bacterium]|nr:hypothetical protein [Verrucomicrobiota bacterium]
MIRNFSNRIHLGTSLLFSVFTLYSVQLHGRGCEQAPCTIGNFALPGSQQPGAFISFGQNILDQNQVQVFLDGTDLIGKDKHFFSMETGIIYGITDDFSALLSVPVAISFKEEGSRSSGLEDIILQLEYAVFTKESACSCNEITIVANASFPTGSSHKEPETGFGSVGYFVGLTYSYTGPYWLAFTSYGAEFPTAHHGTKFGNEYLYQFGFGRNITNTKDWVLAWVAEFDGTFSERDKVHGTTDPDSGGNVIYFTPSFSASSKDWIFQMGFGFAIQQNLFGGQKRDKYLLAATIERSF